VDPSFGGVAIRSSERNPAQSPSRRRATLNIDFRASDLWPSLPYDQMGPTVDHLHRLSQIAGKYTLDQPFEAYWGDVTLLISPRGIATRTLRSDDVLFDIEYAILDSQVVVTASTGKVTLALAAGTVADFYRQFVDAVAALRIPAPRSTLETEIAEARHFDSDTVDRPYDAAMARRMWTAFSSVATALSVWQSAYIGPRPPVGIMWGGFDLYAPRYNGRSLAPPNDRPIFQQNGMNGEVVAVGFSLGDSQSRAAGFYAYISPSPPGIESADFGVKEAAYDAAAGLVVLPWDVARASRNPQDTVLRFADAVYDVAVKLGGWPNNWVHPRHDGWYASRHLIPD
jgi:hypothetical protein